MVVPEGVIKGGWTSGNVGGVPPEKTPKKEKDERKILSRETTTTNLSPFAAHSSSLFYFNA